MICCYFEKKYPDCTNCSTHKIINASENKRTYSVVNKHRKSLCKIKLDACVLKKGSTCDYLFIDCKENTAYFIELKGQDLLKAITQISHAIDQLSDPISEAKKIHARIVLSKVNAPDIRHTALMKFKKKIKKLGGTLRYESRKMTEIID